LIGVMVASFIFLIGTLGSISLIQKSIASGDISSSRLVAVNLAQEGIEVVKNIREINYQINGWDDWYAGILGSVDYLVQYDDSELGVRSFSDATTLKFDKTTGLFGYDIGTDSRFFFKRKVNLTKISDNEIQVTSTMTWVEGGRNHSLVVEDWLWNWR